MLTIIVKVVATIALVYMVRYVGKTLDQFVESEMNPIVDCGNI